MIKELSAMKSTGYGTPFYRSRDGLVFGVFKGLSDRAGISLFWVRALYLGATVLSGIFPGIIVYVIVALLLKPAPILEVRTDEDLDFYMSYTQNRKLALHRLKKQFDSLEDRIRRMEAVVTDREFNWEQRLRSGQ
jgi:phage shock protein C